MIVIKNKISIQRMRTAGRLLAGILEDCHKLVQLGASTLEIDAKIEESMRKVGLLPECIGYAGYKNATCISVNDVIVHGVPSKNIILKDGDLVKIDVVGSYKGYCADMARCFFVGEAPKQARDLVSVAQKALDKAISIVEIGKRISDISSVIQQEVEGFGYNVVRDFVGHGIGKDMHEDPEIPNFGSPGKGPQLQEGMTLAIEPMIAVGSAKVKIMSDGWTACTVDGSLAAHVEDTVLVSVNGPEVLTRIN